MDNSTPLRRKPATFSGLPIELKRMILSYVVTLNVKLPPNALEDHEFSTLRGEIYERTDNCRHILESGHVELRNVMLDMLRKEHNRLARIATQWSRHLAAMSVPQNIESAAAFDDSRRSIRLYLRIISLAFESLDDIFE